MSDLTDRLRGKKANLTGRRALTLEAADRIECLTVALQWAIAEIDGVTTYAYEEQFDNALQKAKEALK